jgi:hypothetical protein
MAEVMFVFEVGFALSRFRKVMISITVGDATVRTVCHPVLSP